MSLGFVGALDCGVRGVGASLWYNRRLMAASYVVNPVLKGMDCKSAAVLSEEVGMWFVRKMIEKGAAPGTYLSRLVIEVMQVYDAAQQKGDQNDLIGVALVCGACAGGISAEDVVTYKPRDWKGTADPDRLIERIKGQIDPTESKTVTLPSAKGLGHNVWDSIGIGLHYYGRLVPLRVFHKE